MVTPDRLAAPPRNPFSAADIDRLAERRRDDAWLAERLRNPRTRFVPVWRLLNAVRHDPFRAVLTGAAELGEAAIANATPILLGAQEGVAFFALEMPDEAAAARVPGEWVELRRVGALLEASEAALLAHARAMVFWHARHLYCGSCGSPTAAAQAGHLRVCTDAACGAHHFPRTDPAVIVLVASGDRCLLGRHAAWDAGRYATLAGFVEPGESLEDAVAREVLEETGVRVTDVRYHSSQPWPFPASLMLGFFARALDEEIRVDPEELEDARWFSRAELEEAVGCGRISLPPPVSIAHALIREWLGSDRR